MSQKKVWFNWHCPYCRKRNRVTFPFQFEMPQHYSAEWECDECGKESKLTMSFSVTENEWNKKTRLRKIKETKKTNKDRDFGTKKDRAYRNDHGEHK